MYSTFSDLHSHELQSQSCWINWINGRLNYIIISYGFFILLGLLKRAVQMKSLTSWTEAVMMWGNVAKKMKKKKIVLLNNLKVYSLIIL